ncbi:MAG: segregation/condensation protein A, partial [Methanoregula sp.]|nr:segregation/condensation protein A [Methanoregula sp.]
MAEQPVGGNPENSSTPPPEISPPGTPGPGDLPVSPGSEEAGEQPVTQGVVEDPVEILVGLAERGEIDPWNINIIEVTDRFLSELEKRRELNLQLSGRT